MNNTLENESFASRWSRRKKEVTREEEELEDVATLDKKEQIPSEEDRLEKLNALTDEDMPDVETLGEDSDYAGFMSINVSEELRKLALQKLFHGKSYNIRDGLDEYDGDYTSFEKLDPSVITADMKHLIEVEAKKLLAEKEKSEQTQKSEELIADELDENDGDIDSENEVVLVVTEPDPDQKMKPEDIDEELG